MPEISKTGILRDRKIFAVSCAERYRLQRCGPVVGLLPHLDVIVKAQAAVEERIYPRQPLALVIDRRIEDQRPPVTHGGCDCLAVARAGNLLHACAVCRRQHERQAADEGGECGGLIQPAKMGEEGVEHRRARWG